MAHTQPSLILSATTAATPKVRIRISPIIECEFRRRNVFHEIRLEKAHRVISGSTGVHLVGIERAREVLAYAQSRRNRGGLVRGLLIAYAALARNISTALQEESQQGLIDDPGPEEVRRQQSAASACFAVGDRVLHFLAHDEYGRVAIITEPYKMYEVADDNGPYIAKDGKRIEYCCGYMIRLNGVEGTFFAYPHQLTRDDCKPSHLRLVASRPASIFC